MDNLYIWTTGIIVINVIVVFVALIGFRWMQGIFAEVSVKEELDHKDNFAFGISVAGGIVSLCFILGAAVGGNASVSLVSEAVNVVLYAVAGIVLLKVGMLVTDKVVLHQLSVPEQLRKQNLAVGIVHGANLVALGIVISAAVGWVETESWTGIGSAAWIFLVALIVILLVTRLRSLVYARRHNNASWQAALTDGNGPLAVRYAGHVLGTAIAIGAVGGLVNYLPEAPWLSVSAWAGYAVAMVVVIWVLYRLALIILLMGIDVKEEVDVQKNYGIAFIEFAIFVGLASIIKVWIV